MRSLRVFAKSKAAIPQLRALSTVSKKSVASSHALVGKEHEHLFSPEYLKFLNALSSEFRPRWRAALAQRAQWWKENATATPTIKLRADTAWIRDDKSWKGPSIAPELKKRWVEITGPAGDAKMVINALNSGANCYMSDFEDSQSPTWSGIVQGQQNLFDANRGQLVFEAKGKRYEVTGKTPSLLVRARGLHMVEDHVVDDADQAVCATLFDISSYLYHNARQIVAKGSRPLMYMPKMESYEDAVLVHDMVKQIEKRLDIPYGTCRITALIETMPGILQAEEIGFGLGAYWAGLNCGRWDYIFSVIKLQGLSPKMIFPDRSALTMDKPFLTQYMQRIVQVSHSRGVHAMGGMSAFLPVSSMSPEDQAKVMDKVYKDKLYEISQGCDGAWVAHPAMVKPVQDLFQKEFKGADNQITSTVNLAGKFDPVGFATPPPAEFTEAGLRANVSVGINYISWWLGGTGAAAIHNLMEDMATAEISRTQVWTWLKHNQQLTSGARTQDVYKKIVTEETNKLQQEVEASSMSAQDKASRLKNIKMAQQLFDTMVNKQELTQFVQDLAYEPLNADVAW